MSTKRQAIVRSSDNVVVNVCVTDTASTWQPPSGYFAVDDDGTAQIGGTYVGGVFSLAPAYVPTWAEIRTARNQRLADSDWSVLVDGSSIPTNRVAWQSYRQALRDVPQSFASPDLIVWPPPPSFTKASSAVNVQFYRIAAVLSAAAQLTLPAAAYIDKILIKNTTANAITGGLKMGTTAGGSDVFSGVAVAANAAISVTDAALLKKFFSLTATQDLFLTAATNWNGASIQAAFIYGQL